MDHYTVTIRNAGTLLDKTKILLAEDPRDALRRVQCKRYEVPIAARRSDDTGQSVIWTGPEQWRNQ